MSVDAPTAQVLTTEPGEGRSADPRELVRGSVFGRFVVTGALGAGGAGSVFAAYDPELDRRVALKMLHGETDAHGDPTGQWRQVVREARALARLSHPNVVIVHDVGVEGDRPWLATELVDGNDLRQWLAAHPRLTDDEILGLFEGAGRGLAAAHVAGLVHGDFKPANVLVGADGRPRVADFGLARLAATAVPTTAPVGDGSEDGTLRIVGTPYYMAPEQLRGVPADTRADQYAFCLSLLEAIGRRRIYDTSSVPKLMIEKARGVPDATFDLLPRWLRAPVERALAASPDDRHPSMDALLAAIAGARARRRRVGWSIGAAGAIGLAVASTYVATVDRSEVVCGGSDRHTAAVWGDAQREALTIAFASAREGGDAAAKRVIALFDAYTVRWIEAHRSVCLAGHHREQSSEIVAARTACLDDRLDGVAALVERLRGADRETVLLSDAAARDLADLERCDDVDLVLRDFGGGEPGDPAEIGRVEKHLRRADAALHLAQFDGAASELAAAEALDATRTVVRLRLAVAVRRGTVDYEIGRFDDARRVLEPAILEAVAADQDESALRGLSPLLLTLGPVMLEFDEAAAWARWGDPIAVRGRVAPQVHARALQSVAMIDAARGDDRAARTRLEQAIALLVAAREPAMGIAQLEIRLAAVLSALGLQAEALPMAEKARTVIGESVGVDHPDYAVATGTLGMIEWRRGEPRALELVAQAVRELEAAHGPEHAALAPALNNLGAVLGRAGQQAQSREVLKRSLELERRRFGPNHVVTGPTLVNLATAALWMGQPEQALEELVEAERVFMAKDADRPELGGVLRQKSYALAELGRVAEANTAADAAVVLVDRHRVKDPLARADVRLQQGWVRALTPDYEASKRTYDEAVSLLEGSDTLPSREGAAMLAAILRGRADVLEEMGNKEAAAVDRARAAGLVPVAP